MMHRGLCYVESDFKNIFFYMLQLVTPSVVAMAVRKEIAICKIVFQVFAFIIFIIIGKFSIEVQKFEGFQAL